MTKFFLSIALLPALLLAERTGVRVEDIPSEKDTTIMIKKGVKDLNQCIEYEIIDGSEEIIGSPEFDRTKARTQWKEACKEWRDNLKELNKSNSLINLTCGSPSMIREEENKYSYHSKAAYKVKVRIKEKG